MRSRTCCVIGCGNNEKKNPNVKFFKFPRIWYKREQRNLWIAAVRRKNPDGTPWEPRIKDEICSDHFVGNMKSDNQFSPSYVPTIFPDVYKKRKINENAAIKRHERFMQRRNKLTTPGAENQTGTSISSQLNDVSNSSSIEMNTTNSNDNFNENSSSNDGNNDEEIGNTAPITEEMSGKFSRESQVDFPRKNLEAMKTFICNRFIMNNVCEVEIQTELSEYKKQTRVKMLKCDKCNSQLKEYKNKNIGCDIYDENDIIINFKN